jgi:hypothetical protein
LAAETFDPLPLSVFPRFLGKECTLSFRRYSMKGRGRQKQKKGLP